MWSRTKPNAKLEIDDAKRLTLAELLEDIGADEPVVVFCRFRRDLTVVADLAQYFGRSYGELSGRFKTGLDERGCMVDGIQVMGVQIQSGGVGVDLTRARYAVYYSLGFSLGRLRAEPGPRASSGADEAYALLPFDC
jgi:hypothetical protein